MYKLSDIASIHSGKLFKNGVNDEKEGTPVVQIRDVAEGKSVDWEAVARVKLSRFPRHYLKNGDVIFLTKGIENHAVVIEGLKEEAIATSHFFYIRPNEKIDSKFLAFQLNSRRSKSYFRDCYKSGRKKHITKVDLAGTPINLPVLREQIGFLGIEETLTHQNALLNTVIEANTKLIESLLYDDDVEGAVERLSITASEYLDKFLRPEQVIALIKKYILLQGDSKESFRKPDLL
jgi:restriction endonuclease S subunit